MGHHNSGLGTADLRQLPGAYESMVAVEFRRRDESTQRARSPATEPHGLVRRALRAGQMGSQLLRMRLAC